MYKQEGGGGGGEVHYNIYTYDTLEVLLAGEKPHYIWKVFSILSSRHEGQLGALNYLLLLLLLCHLS